MKNLEILISKSLFFGLAFLCEARQSISCSISLFLTVINWKVISREFLGIADLTKTQTFCIHKSTEVVVVIKDKDLIFAVF